MIRAPRSLIVIVLVACGTHACDGSSASPTSPLRSSNEAATVLSSFGSTENFKNFASAERELGWRVLRPQKNTYTLVRQGGLIRTLPEVGIPRLEQHYAANGHKALVEFVQEPSAYTQTIHEGRVRETIDGWQGQIWHSGDQAGFIFDTGETTHGQNIRASVWGTSGYTEDDIRAFVRSLAFSP